MTYISPVTAWSILTYHDKVELVALMVPLVIQIPTVDFAPYIRALVQIDLAERHMPTVIVVKTFTPCTPLCCGRLSIACFSLRHFLGPINEKFFSHEFATLATLPPTHSTEIAELCTTTTAARVSQALSKERQSGLT